MPKRILALLLALLLTATLTACGSKSDEDESSDPSEGESAEEQLQDGDEYPVTVNGVQVRSRPVRVLSLAPSITEKLYDLGFEDRLVGLSDYCDYPEHIITLPRYGTAQYPDVDAILDLDPHVVLSGAQLPAAVTAELDAAGITVVTLGTAGSVGELEEIYTQLARVMEGGSTGEIFAQRFLQQDFRPRLESLRASGDTVALYLREMPYTIAPGNSLVGELLEWVGYENIAADQRDWLSFASQAEQPSFSPVEIIFMDRRDVTIRDLEQSEIYKSLTATLQDLYLYIDCDRFERQSMRMFDELERVARARVQGVDGDGNLLGEEFDESSPDDGDGGDSDAPTSWEEAWDG